MTLEAEAFCIDDVARKMKESIRAERDLDYILEMHPYRNWSCYIKNKTAVIQYYNS